MAIDMNPNGIGVAVLENGKYIHTEHVDMSDVVKDGTSDKINHETFEVAKRLTTLAKHYLCATFVVEDLSMRSKNHKKGKKLNKLINNNWKRQKLANNISKRCKLCGIKYLPVQAAFSSIVGNNLFSTQPDPICAAMEIARRGVEILKTKRYSLPPVVLNERVQNRRKEDGLSKAPDSWKELNEWMKNVKLWYRISPDSFAVRVCRSKSLKSKVFVKTYDFR